MIIRWEDLAGGTVTRATYTGPDGEPMSASFSGCLGRDEVEQELKRCRRIAATVTMNGETR